MKGKKVIITGISGMIGTALANHLQAAGYTVEGLTTSGRNIGNFKCYTWNPAKREIDQQALNGADYIVHLAGAGVADKRITKERKLEILNSRVDSANLLLSTIKENGLRPNAFIAASAVGIYGADRKDELLFEDSAYENDFIASVTKQWEAATSKFRNVGIRTVQIRISVVLSDHGGALEKITPMIRKGGGSVLGSGKQMMSCIHIDDL
jgi:uncharacterized protein